jgi:ATP-dependent Clp protease protease subunit
MIHQPSSGAQGMISDIEIAFNESLKTKNLLHEFYSQKTGQSVSQVIKDMDRDTWFEAKEALEYGLVDKILQTKDNSKTEKINTKAKK